MGFYQKSECLLEMMQPVIFKGSRGAEWEQTRLLFTV